MPAFCTHYIFYKEMADFLKEDADFKFNTDAAAIGTQGPDIFFFHRIIPVFMPGLPKSKVGSALHRAKPAAIFDAFRDYCKFSPNLDIAKSYIYGFILHYALDRQCHPFVYSFQEKILQMNNHLHKSSAHNRIEMAMDTYMLNKHMNYTQPFEFDAAATITSDISVIEEIAHLLSFVIPRVTDKQINEKDILQAILDTKRIQKILRDRNGVLRYICRVTESIFAPIIGYYKFSAMIKPRDLEKAKKYGNINRQTWISPYDNTIKHNESFEDLFELSKSDAKKLISGFNKMCMGYSNGYEITQNISFLTGIEVK
ncbi:MAG: zinc dependent phospholipase C family protein [Eubacterium sp.]